MEKLLRAIIAGMFISLGGAIFLKVGGVVGAFMFAFGLLSVVHFACPLYTGTAGFIDILDFRDYKSMLLILIGNILGCYLTTMFDVQGVTETAATIIQSRINAGFRHCLFASMGCGFIMTVVVQAGRDREITSHGIYVEGRAKNLLLIILGIPIFILLGFYHSIADAYYFFQGGMNKAYLPYYAVIVLGNFIGCNIPNILNYKND